MSSTAAWLISGPIAPSSSGSPIGTCSYALTRRETISSEMSLGDEPPLRGCTAAQPCPPRRSTAFGEVEVGVVHHDDRVVAPQFEDGASEALRHTATATRSPMVFDPVAETSGMRPSLISASPTSEPLPTTRLKTPRTRCHPSRGG